MAKKGFKTIDSGVKIEIAGNGENVQPSLANWSGPDQVHAGGGEIHPGVKPGKTSMSDA